MAMFNNPSDLIWLKYVTDEWIVITNTQALRIIEVDWISIWFSAEKKQMALNWFSWIMFWLKFPIQIMCTVSDFNENEYITEKHIQNREKMKSNLPIQLKEEFEDWFRYVNSYLNPKVRKYYIIVGTNDTAKKLIKR